MLVKKWLGYALLAFTLGGMHGRRVIEAATCTANSSSSLQSCLNNLNAGDIVNIQGIESGVTTPYRSDVFTITNRNTGCGSRATIQPANYSGAGTGDTVFFDGGNPSANAWTHCTFGTVTPGFCDTPCNNLPPGQIPCLETWYQSGTSSYNLASWVVKPDGSPVYKVRAMSSMTNFHSTYNSKRCVGAGNDTGWRACDTSSDCPSGQTCTSGASPEVDFYYNSGQAFIRPGQSTPSNYYLINNSNAIGMLIQHSCNITVQGLKFRVYGRSAIGIYPGAGSSSGIIFDDITGYYFMFGDGGPDYAVILYDAPDPIVRNSNFAYSQSELLHTVSRNSTVPANVMALDFHNNWMHHAGDITVLGEMLAGGPETPGGIIFAVDGYTSSDYSGTNAYGNLFQDIKFFSRNGDGIKFEDIFNGSVGTHVKVHDNFFARIDNSALRFETVAGNSSYVDLYANIIFNSGIHPNPANGDPGAAIHFSTSSFNLTNINIFNNTIWNGTNSPGILAQSFSGLTQVTVNNNIIYEANGNTQALNWAPTSATNTFKNNLFFSGKAPLLTVAGTDYNDCPTFNASSFGGADRCNEDPGFYDLTHYLFYPMGGQGITPGNAPTNATLNPPTVDGGTATGQPAAHTTGIVNTLAAAHGFGFYSDSVAQGGSAWDIGAVESLLPYGTTPLLVANAGPWTAYTPSGCSSGSTVGTSGAGFVFRTERSPSTLCKGVSQTLTLTVGQTYYAFLRRSTSVLGLDDVTVDGATPPNYSIPGTNIDACGEDRVDDWHLDATNATISEIYYPFAYRGPFQTPNPIPHVYSIVPTANPVTLKVEVVSGGLFLNCADVVYFFDPIILVPKI